jgi:peptidoglycan/LPS O-acetylase OafA/YrhL
MAAVSVTFFHWNGGGWFTSELIFPFPNLFSNNSLVEFSRFGWIAVDLFFVISGFLIVDSISKRSFPSFAKARFLRLIPTYWLITFLTFLISIFTIKRPNFYHFLGSLIGLNFINGNPPYIPAAWTLAVEIQFYLLASSVFLLRSLPNAWFHFSWVYLVAGGTLQFFQPEGLYFIAVWPFGPLFILGISIRILREKVSAFNLILFSACICMSVYSLEQRLIEWNAISKVSATLVSVIAILSLSFAMTLGNIRKGGNTDSIAVSVITYCSKMTYPFYLLHESFEESLISFSYHVTQSAWISFVATSIIILALSHITLKVADLIIVYFERTENKTVKLKT